MATGQWCRRRGCKRTIKSFDLVKIRAKSLKIREKPVKTFAKSLKIWTEMPPNVVWLEKKWFPTFSESYEDFFWRPSQTKVCLRKCSHKKWPKRFSGKFGEIRAKIFRTPKNLPDPTPRPVAAGGIRGQSPPNFLRVPPNFLVPRKICFKNIIKTKIVPP